MGAEPARGKTLLAASLGLLLAVVAPFKSGRQALAQTVGPATPAEAAGAQPAAPAQQVWSGYFNENPRVLEKLGVQPLHAPALSRLLAETALQPESLKGQAGKQARAIRAEVGVLAQKAIEDAGRAKSGAAQEQDGLRRRLRDVYAALPAVPEQQRAAVAAGHALVEARNAWTEEAREKTRRLLEGAAQRWEDKSGGLAPQSDAAPQGKTDWLTPAVQRLRLKQLAEEFDLERRLSSSGNYKKEKKKAEIKPQWSPLLVKHQGVIAAMEHGEPDKGVEHVLGLAQLHRAEALDGWLGFLQKLGGDAAAHWNRLTFELANEISSEFMSLDEDKRGLWSTQYWGVSDYTLNRPAPEHLQVLAFKYALHARIDGVEPWSALRRFFETGLKTSKSKDLLRTALRLVSLRLKGAVPYAFWEKMIQSPPETHEEREALGAIAVALGNPSTKWETRELLVHPQVTMPARLDYRKVMRGLLLYLQDALAKKIELSAEEARRLDGHPVLSDAAQPGGVMQNLLLYSSFANRWGRSSLKRLLSELLQSPLENGRIRHLKRYEKLKGAVPAPILERWMRDYEKAVPVYDGELAAAPAALPIDRAEALQRLKGHLGVSSSGELDALAPRVQALAARLRQEPAFEASSSWVEALQNDFLPGVKTILDDLTSSRAPPAELLKRLLPILAKAQIMKEVLAEPQAALKDFKELLAASPEKTERKKSLEARELVLHVTDDPAAMLQMGNLPKLTCQRCAEPTGHNNGGRPLNRLLLGQLKVANWTKGGKIAGRSVVELGTDRWGAPALLVEPLYGANLPVAALQKSIEDYARQLGVAKVFFTDKSLTENQPWLVAGLDMERFKAHRRRWLMLYRDTDVSFGSAVPVVILDEASKVRFSWVRGALAELFVGICVLLGIFGGMGLCIALLSSGHQTIGIAAAVMYYVSAVILAILSYFR